jgi:hypothetical protein
MDTTEEKPKTETETENDFWDCSFKPDNWEFGKRSIPDFGKASDPFLPKTESKNAIVLRLPSS